MARLHTIILDSPQDNDIGLWLYCIGLLLYAIDLWSYNIDLLFTGSQETPNIETIDNYMARLHTIILDSPQDNEKLIATVRDIVGRLNIDG